MAHVAPSCQAYIGTPLKPIISSDWNACSASFRRREAPRLVIDEFGLNKCHCYATVFFAPARHRRLRQARLSARGPDDRNFNDSQGDAAMRDSIGRSKARFAAYNTFGAAREIEQGRRAIGTTARPTCVASRQACPPRGNARSAEICRPLRYINRIVALPRSLRPCYWSGPPAEKPSAPYAITPTGGILRSSLSSVTG
jgi:hypothetical protein